MGKYGGSLGECLGGLAGEFAGEKLGRFTGLGAPEGKTIGTKIGGFLGNLIPFKKGGRVRKNTRALLHKGEYVLPAGVKPTKAQIKAVKKRGGKK